MALSLSVEEFRAMKAFPATKRWLGRWHAQEQQRPIAAKPCLGLGTIQTKLACVEVMGLETSLHGSRPRRAGRFPQAATLAVAMSLAWLMMAVWVGGVLAAEPDGDKPAAATTSDESDGTVDFARDVQPLLAKHCYKCHGPRRQESNYRLDVRQIAMAGGDFGEAAIVPGKAAESALIDYVSGQGDVVMPPEGEQPLDDGEVALLRAWIDQGAKWPDDLAGDAAHQTLSSDHWSLKPLRQVEPPEVDDGGWSRNGIDRFIFARLAAAGLQPSDEADRRTLIRRLYLDMHGLPPTPEEIDAFVDDRRADAYERLVDRVLASPHYGERWARHWLDVVRFAETNGFETNTPRPNAYPYRDYVIRALNEDKPYDEFVFEQLAGDAVGEDAATGFLVGGPWDSVKSPDVGLTLMQRQNELADMINTTGTAFLGLTLGCARCHNHKFDPVLQKDYYSLQAVFAGVRHGERPWLTAEYKARKAKADEVGARLAQLRQKLSPWGQRLRRPVSPKQNVEQFPPVEARWVRLIIEQTNDQTEPCVDELEVFAAGTYGTADARNMALAAEGVVVRSSGDYPGHAIHKLEHINDGRYGNERSWISDTRGKGWVEIELAEPVLIDHVVWGRDRKGRYRDRLAVQYRVEVARTPGTWQVVASSADRVPWSKDAKPHGAWRYDLSGLSESERATAESLLRQVESLEAEYERLNAPPPKVYAGRFEQPGTTYRLYRGDPMQKREPVVPDALTVLGSLGLEDQTPEQQRRVALARWIASADNPLTARVMVNRVWHYHFGTGIVDTPSDFGSNGSRPSHPDLLDWLAGEFIRGDWSLKRLHRLILTSSTYRQSSRPRESALAVDAGSRLLWRFPPRRLEAEAIRDSILKTSGVLNLKMGGPGFSAFEPNENYVRVYKPRETFDADGWRRMVYMTKVRMEQDGVFGAFDCPDAGQVCPRRSRSTTAIQALNLLNSRFVMRQAGLFAQRVQREAGADEAAQVRRAFRLALGRGPDAWEQRTAGELVTQHGLTALCRALLNANEFLFIP